MADELHLHASKAMELGDVSAGSEMINIVAKNFGEAWQPMLQQEWEEGIVSDMILKVGGKSFKVHRLVMLVHSPRLRQKIRLADPQKMPLEVSLDMDAAMVEKALDFMYRGQVEVAKTQLQPLAELAQVLGIASLKKLLMLEQLIRTEVTIQNCLSIWDAASESGNKQLAQEAKAMALENFPSLQHSADLKALSAKILLEYLTSDALVTARPEERLLAALYWLQVDPTSRHKHLCPILDSVSLDEMGWFLGHALNLPLIQDSSEARERIQKAMERVASHSKKTLPVKQKEAADVGKPKGGDHTKASLPKPEAPVSKGQGSHHYLVVTGHRKDDTVSNEVVAVNLNKNFECIPLGQIKAEFDDWTNCCIQGGNLFVCCLGSTRNEVWRFQLQERSASLQTRLRTPRYCHGMTAHHTGCLYIMGGMKPSDSSLIRTVDPTEGTGLVLGSLKQNTCISYINLRSCEVECGDLAVVGAQDSQCHTTLQLWSPSTASTTTSVSLGKDVWGVYGVVQADGHIIVVGDEATVVCKVHKDGLQNVKVCDKYKSPNQGCAVVLTPQDYILIVGGVDRSRGSVSHCVYRARVHDVINNTGHGWQSVESKCTLGDHYIYGYDTTNLPLQA